MVRTARSTAAALSPVAIGDTIRANGSHPPEQELLDAERFIHLGDETIIICDLSGIVVGANSAATRLFAGTPEDLLGRRLTELFDDDEEVLLDVLRRADKVAPDEAIVERHTTEGIDLEGRRVPVELRLRHLPRSSQSLVLTVIDYPSDCRHDASAALPLGRLHAVRSTTEFQRELIIELMREHGVNGLADSLHQRTGCPVVIFDSSRRLLAEAGVSMTDRSVVQRVRDGLTDAGHGVVMRWFGCWSAAIIPDDHLLGWVCLLDDVAGVGGGECLALEEAVSIVTLELLRLQRVAEVQAASLRELADQLIADPTSTRVMALAEALTYDLRGAHQVMAVRVARGVEEGGEDRSTLTEETLRELGVRSPLVADRGNRLFLVLPCDDRPPSDEETYYEELAVALEDALGSDVQVGVGGNHELLELKRSLHEALFALEIRDSLHSKRRFTVFQGLGFWKFLHDSGESPMLRQVVDEWIGELIRHDAAQRSELVKTLTVYLNESGATESAATALFIHRNTLRYRLTKIAQVTGHDISDLDERFQLELACRAWEVLQALEAADANDHDPQP